MKRFASRKSDYLPSKFYNIKADLSELPKPPLNPATKEPLNPEDLEPLFPKGFIKQEGTLERYVPVPGKILDRENLQTPAHIFYKYEGVGPTGSHKSNTALVQAYLAAKEGVEVMTTETGAGQWGSALAHAGSIFGIEVKVFMVRISYRQKPGRKILMRLFGASVEESPSNITDAGKKFYSENPEHPGSLGIAISEAVETAAKKP
jgi:tryptophan synthase beta chain